MAARGLDIYSDVIVKRDDLEGWLRNPGNVTGSDLLRAALRRGWAVRRQAGDHVILDKQGFSRNLAIDLGTKANGTKRSIIRTLLEASDDVDDSDG